jgi:hypothetical protein
MPGRERTQVCSAVLGRAEAWLLHAYTGHDGDVAPSTIEQQRLAGEPARVCFHSEGEVQGGGKVTGLYLGAA